MTTVAFIGLGSIGPSMISCLLRGGYRVVAFDPCESGSRRARAVGAAAQDNAAAAADGADVVITLLPTGIQVQRTWSEVLPHLKETALLIDCSTISVDSAKRAHQTAAHYGLPTVDAPAFGCDLSAREGRLSFFCGGDQSVFLSARPLLAAMGTSVIHCGEAGAGQAAKICNSMLLGVSMIAVSETFSLGEQLGLSHQALFDVVCNLSRECWSRYCPVPGLVSRAPANDDYRAGLAASTMLSDLQLSQDAARRAGVFTPLGWHTENIYDEFEKAGHGATDFSAIIRHLRALTRYTGV